MSGPRQHSSKHRHSGKKQTHLDASAEANRNNLQRLEALRLILDAKDSKIPENAKAIFLSQIARISIKINDHPYGNISQEIDLIAMAINADEHVRTLSRARGSVILKNSEGVSLSVEEIKADPDDAIQMPRANPPPPRNSNQTRPSFFWSCLSCADVIEDAEAEPSRTPTNRRAI